MKVIAVVGTKKTGKTTLVEALVRSLAKHGKVGTVKNMVDHPVDRGDTRRHFDAGADVVIGMGEARLLVRRDRGDLESALAELEREGMDYAVVEGFKNSSLFKIVMADIEVPNMVRRVRLPEVDEDLVAELAEMVRGMEDYKTAG
ncbi:MAG: molybdopterin-guanine dinucleotide biosynthesis protein B [Methanothrix sp.]|jgi:molybdopterin-guanine dinucleotide biosynthesis protein MobB|uniref:molybdopterin-guanine dinucleotide biosynthesis protein B n=1 Tax=Methanothrix sp. TaxID=90426 RepID=UPI001B7C50D6|nr:molybdopterin-guanine dinucleotide biosynthesis protein B [Methanothrix sp.]MBP7067818.1 molybdopterin-guanine dinucleotide biosynthesis protein B [Methanothrix sp.]